MPLFLDLHELPDGITAAHVAVMHKADLDIQHIQMSWPDVLVR